MHRRLIPERELDLLTEKLADFVEVPLESQTGDSRPAELTAAEANGQPVTTVHLVLPPVSSLFYVGE